MKITHYRKHPEKGQRATATIAKNKMLDMLKDQGMCSIAFRAVAKTTWEGTIQADTGDYYTLEGADQDDVRVVTGNLMKAGIEGCPGRAPDAPEAPAAPDDDDEF